MTFNYNDFINQVAKNYLTHEGNQRYGQFIMNGLQIS